MLKQIVTVGALMVTLAFAMACGDIEDIDPKVKIKSNIHINTNKIVFDYDEHGEYIDSEWTIGELVKDSTWTVENMSAKLIYPKTDNQITFIGDDVIQLDWGSIAAIRTSADVPVSLITCKLLSGGGGGLILYLEFERSGILVCSTVHVLFDSINEMTWVGYENVSILRRVGDYEWDYEWNDDDDDDDDDGKGKKKDRE